MEEKQQPIITDEEYSVIRKVFEKLDTESLLTCGGILEKLNTWSFILLFKRTPTIIQMLMQAADTPGKKKVVTEFVEAYSNACEVLANIAECSNIITDADYFFSEIGRK